MSTIVVLIVYFLLTIGIVCTPVLRLLITLCRPLLSLLSIFYWPLVLSVPPSYDFWLHFVDHCCTYCLFSIDHWYCLYLRLTTSDYTLSTIVVLIVYFLLTIGIVCTSVDLITLCRPLLSLLSIFYWPLVLSVPPSYDFWLHFVDHCCTYCLFSIDHWYCLYPRLTTSGYTLSTIVVYFLIVYFLLTIGIVCTIGIVRLTTSDYTLSTIVVLIVYFLLTIGIVCTPVLRLLITLCRPLLYLLSIFYWPLVLSVSPLHFVDHCCTYCLFSIDHWYCLYPRLTTSDYTLSTIVVLIVYFLLTIGIVCTPVLRLLITLCRPLLYLLSIFYWPLVLSVPLWTVLRPFCTSVTTLSTIVVLIVYFLLTIGIVCTSVLRLLITLCRPLLSLLSIFYWPLVLSVPPSYDFWLHFVDHCCPYCLFSIDHWYCLYPRLTTSGYTLSTIVVLIVYFLLTIGIVCTSVLRLLITLCRPLLYLLSIFYWPLVLSVPPSYDFWLHFVDHCCPYCLFSIDHWYCLYLRLTTSDYTLSTIVVLIVYFLLTIGIVCTPVLRLLITLCRPLLYLLSIFYWPLVLSVPPSYDFWLHFVLTIGIVCTPVLRLLITLCRPLLYLLSIFYWPLVLSVPPSYDFWLLHFVDHCCPYCLFSIDHWYCLYLRLTTSDYTLSTIVVLIVYFLLTIGIVCTSVLRLLITLCRPLLYLLSIFYWPLVLVCLYLRLTTSGYTLSTIVVLIVYFLLTIGIVCTFVRLTTSDYTLSTIVVLIVYFLLTIGIVCTSVLRLLITLCRPLLYLLSIFYWPLVLSVPPSYDFWLHFVDHCCTYCLFSIDHWYCLYPRLTTSDYTLSTIVVLIVYFLLTIGIVCTPVLRLLYTLSTIVVLIVYFLLTIGIVCTPVLRLLITLCRPLLSLLSIFYWPLVLSVPPSYDFWLHFVDHCCPYCLFSIDHWYCLYLRLTTSDYTLSTIVVLIVYFLLTIGIVCTSVLRLLITLCRPLLSLLSIFYWPLVLSVPPSYDFWLHFVDHCCTYCLFSIDHWYCLYPRLTTSDYTLSTIVVLIVYFLLTIGIVCTPVLRLLITLCRPLLYLLSIFYWPLYCLYLRLTTSGYTLSTIVVLIVYFLLTIGIVCTPVLRLLITLCRPLLSLLSIFYWPLVLSVPPSYDFWLHFVDHCCTYCLFSIDHWYCLYPRFTTSGYTLWTVVVLIVYFLLTIGIVCTSVLRLLITLCRPLLYLLSIFYWPLVLSVPPSYDLWLHFVDHCCLIVYFLLTIGIVCTSVLRLLSLCRPLLYLLSIFYWPLVLSVPPSLYTLSTIDFSIDHWYCLYPRLTTSDYTLSTIVVLIVYFLLTIGIVCTPVLRLLITLCRPLLYLLSIFYWPLVLSVPPSYDFWLHFVDHCCTYCLFSIDHWYCLYLFSIDHWYCLYPRLTTSDYTLSTIVVLIVYFLLTIGIVCTPVLRLLVTLCRPLLYLLSIFYWPLVLSVPPFYDFWLHFVDRCCPYCLFSLTMVLSVPPSYDFWLHHCCTYCLFSIDHWYCLYLRLTTSDYTLSTIVVLIVYFLLTIGIVCTSVLRLLITLCRPLLYLLSIFYWPLVLSVPPSYDFWLHFVDHCCTYCLFSIDHWYCLYPRLTTSDYTLSTIVVLIVYFLLTISIVCITTLLHFVDHCCTYCLFSIDHWYCLYPRLTTSDYTLSTIVVLIVYFLLTIGIVCTPVLRLLVTLCRPLLYLLSIFYWPLVLSVPPSYDFWLHFVDHCCPYCLFSIDHWYCLYLRLTTSDYTLSTIVVLIVYFLLTIGIVCTSVLRPLITLCRPLLSLLSIFYWPLVLSVPPSYDFWLHFVDHCCTYCLFSIDHWYCLYPRLTTSGYTLSTIAVLLSIFYWPLVLSVPPSYDFWLHFVDHCCTYCLFSIDHWYCLYHDFWLHFVDHCCTYCLFSIDHWYCLYPRLTTSDYTLSTIVVLIVYFLLTIGIVCTSVLRLLITLCRPLLYLLSIFYWPLVLSVPPSYDFWLHFVDHCCPYCLFSIDHWYCLYLRLTTSDYTLSTIVVLIVYFLLTIGIVCTPVRSYDFCLLPLVLSLSTIVVVLIVYFLLTIGIVCTSVLRLLITLCRPLLSLLSIFYWPLVLSVPPSYDFWLHLHFVDHCCLYLLSIFYWPLVLSVPPSYDFWLHFVDHCCTYCLFSIDHWYCLYLRLTTSDYTLSTIVVLIVYFLLTIGIVCTSVLRLLITLCRPLLYLLSIFYWPLVLSVPPSPVLWLLITLCRPLLSVLTTSGYTLWTVVVLIVYFLLTIGIVCTSVLRLLITLCRPLLYLLSIFYWPLVLSVPPSYDFWLHFVDHCCPYCLFSIDHWYCLYLRLTTSDYTLSTIVVLIVYFLLTIGIVCTPVLRLLVTLCRPLLYLLSIFYWPLVLSVPPSYDFWLHFVDHCCTYCLFSIDHWYCLYPRLTTSDYTLSTIVVLIVYFLLTIGIVCTPVLRLLITLCRPLLYLLSIFYWPLVLSVPPSYDFWLHFVDHCCTYCLFSIDHWYCLYPRLTTSDYTLSTIVVLIVYFLLTIGIVCTSVLRLLITLCRPLLYLLSIFYWPLVLSVPPSYDFWLHFVDHCCTYCLFSIDHWYCLYPRLTTSGYTLSTIVVLIVYFLLTIGIVCTPVLRLLLHFVDHCCTYCLFSIDHWYCLYLRLTTSGYTLSTIVVLIVYFLLTIGIVCTSVLRLLITLCRPLLSLLSIFYWPLVLSVPPSYDFWLHFVDHCCIVCTPVLRLLITLCRPLLSLLSIFYWPLVLSVPPSYDFWLHFVDHCCTYCLFSIDHWYCLYLRLTTSDYTLSTIVVLIVYFLLTIGIVCTPVLRLLITLCRPLLSLLSIFYWPLVLSVPPSYDFWLHFVDHCCTYCLFSIDHWYCLYLRLTTSDYTLSTIVVLIVYFLLTIGIVCTSVLRLLITLCRPLLSLLSIFYWPLVLSVPPSYDFWLHFVDHCCTYCLFSIDHWYCLYLRLTTSDYTLSTIVVLLSIFYWPLVLSVPLTSDYTSTIVVLIVYFLLTIGIVCTSVLRLLITLCRPLLYLLSIFYWPLVFSVPPSYDFWLHFVEHCCTYCLFSIDHWYCLYPRFTTSDYTLSTIVVLIVYFLLTIGIVCTSVLRLLITLCRPLLSLLSIFYWPLVLSVPPSYDFWLHFVDHCLFSIDHWYCLYPRLTTSDYTLSTIVVLIVYFLLTIGIVCTSVLRLLITLCRPLLSLLSIFYWPLVLSVPPSYDFWLHFVDHCCTYCLFSIDHWYCLYLRLTTSDYTLSTIVVLIVYFLLTIGIVCTSVLRLLITLCRPLLYLLSIFYWPLVLSVPPSYDFWLHFVDHCCTYCLFSIDHWYCLYLRLTTSDYSLSTIVVLIVYFLLTIDIVCTSVLRLLITLCRPLLSLLSIFYWPLVLSVPPSYDFWLHHCCTYCLFSIDHWYCLYPRLTTSVTTIVLIVYFLLTIGIVCTSVLRLLITLCRPLLSLLSIFYWLVLSVPLSYDFWLHFGIFKLSFRKWVKISTFHSILWIKDLNTHTYSI